MKLSVSSYSFARMHISQLECVARAHELGFAAIEFTDLTPPDGGTALEYAAQLRAEAEKYGMTINAYTVGADFLTGHDGDLDREVAATCEKVDIAAALGAPLMRHDATQGKGARGFNRALPRLADGCRRVTEYAAARGIRTCVENHGTFCQDSDRVERLMLAVDHPNFGWLVDVGNFLCADENPVRAVGRAAPYAVHAHVKDFYIRSGDGRDPGEGFFRTRGMNYLRGAIVGQGDAPVAQCLAILRHAGYNGWLSIEFEGRENPMYGIRVGRDNVRRMWPETD